VKDVALQGIVLGRFQPLHVGHVEYLEAARHQCGRLFIGITNPDEESRIPSAADPRRSDSDANPFTYLERHLMIEDALLSDGWGADTFCIVPAPIREPQRLKHYLPSPGAARCFLTVYDAWGDEKVSVMSDLGYSVEVLWRRTHEQRATSGTAIRSFIRDREPWQHLVPPKIALHVQMHLNRVEL
jgi:cytidyltransferase-like protein